MSSDTIPPQTIGDASRAPLPRGTPRRGRRVKNNLFLALCILSTSVSVAILAILLGAIFFEGTHFLDGANRPEVVKAMEKAGKALPAPGERGVGEVVRAYWIGTKDFLTTFPSRKPAGAGFKAAFWGSIWLCALSAIVAMPIGVGAAIFLEEYKPKNRFMTRLHSFIQINITNLAGVPSIVYGIVGLTVFVRVFGLFGSPNLSMYDDQLRVKLDDGRVVQGDIISVDGDVRELKTTLDGTLTLRTEDIRWEDTVYVRSHEFVLKDGRRLAGRLGDYGPDQIELINEKNEMAAFAPAEVDRYQTSTMFEFGKENSFFYFRLPPGGSVLAGGLTLMLVILPVVIISSREALRAVPGSLREASFALGSTRWQMVRRMILPCATPGIMTGAILATSRAIGEAAPLLVVGGFLFITFTPRNIMDDFAAMPLQIFNWAGRPQEDFHDVAASGIIVLLAVLLAFNLVAIIIRQKFEKPLQ